MNFSSPSEGVLKHLFDSGYKINLVPHRSAWSAHIFHSSFQGIDSDKIFGGTSYKKEVAISKAVSEYVERNAFKENGKTNRVLDSTGFAARPLGLFPALTKIRTRWSAMHEAMERYYAFHWWEDNSISHSVKKIDKGQDTILVSLDLADKFDQVMLIQIDTPGFEDVLMLAGMRPNKGFTIGCAAGWSWERPNSLFRASVELMRHYHIVERLLKGGIQPDSAYSKKLLHFASGALDKQLKSRLGCIGSKTSKKPVVSFDDEISHQFNKQYYVHRFVFKDQPDIVASSSNIII